MNFTDEQQAAITFAPTTQLIVAGAGSGKTTVMAERIAHLALTVPPEHILGLTFSNKAASHLRTAVTKRLGPDSDVTISTYHGFGSSLVTRHAAALGFVGSGRGSRPQIQPTALSRPPRLIDFAQSLQLLFDIFESAEFVQRKTGNPLFILREALQLSSRMSDHLVDPHIVALDCERLANDTDALDELRKAARSRVELIPLIEAYRTKKRELGLLDHDDQIRLAVEAVTHIDGVVEGLRASYHAVLLDEYQDTNFAQRRLLQLIFGAEPESGGASAGRAITAVGDDMQSIYAFRGAHLKNLHSFSEHFSPGSATADQPLQTLSQSFRNDRIILELANRMQAEVAGAQPKVLSARPEASDGELLLFLARDSSSEAGAIAERIQQLQAAGSSLSEIAILCRKRRLIPPLVDALDTMGIAVEVLGLGGLLARPEIVELCCWLETIARPDERNSGVAVTRLLRGDRYRIGLHDLAILGRNGGIERGLSRLDDLAQLSSQAHIRMRRFVTERQDLRQAATQLGLVEFIEHVLARIGLWEAVDGDRPMENLARFLHVAEQFRPLQGRRSLAEFFTWLKVMDEAEEDLSEASGSSQDAVQIMTIHQAKGLEFDHVFVPGLSGSKGSRIFPDTTRAEFPPTFGASLPWWLREDNEGVEQPPATSREIKSLREQNTRRQVAEEWRLFYVATTRARHSVFFSGAHWYFDTQSPQGPSMFHQWLSRQNDIVTNVGSEDPAPSSPGTRDRERRAQQAKTHRVDTETAFVAPVKRGRKSVGEDQLGFMLPASQPSPSPVSVPQSLPVSAIVALNRCARQFHWTHIRPMPRHASSAAILGTQIHSWIEHLGRGQGSLFPDEVLAAATNTLPVSVQTDNMSAYHVEADASPTVAQQLRKSFLTSRYGELVPARVEHPIALSIDSLLIRGRVDAAYTEGETLHVVDFKTGRPLDADDPSLNVQLDLYGLAAIRLWGADENHLRTSAAYLHKDGSGVTDHTIEWTAARTATVERLLVDSVTRIQAGDKQPHTGAWCSRCPFLDLCPEGKRQPATTFD
jgi:DNA helicase II / ATP-dependent DNA helicase PcrA